MNINNLTRQRTYIDDYHDTDNYITEIISEEKLVALIYKRRDTFNHTNINMIDMEPSLSVIEQNDKNNILYDDMRTEQKMYFSDKDELINYVCLAYAVQPFMVQEHTKDDKTFLDIYTKTGLFYAIAGFYKFLN